jgi:hypothetical protein
MKLNKIFFLSTVSILSLPLMAFKSNNFDYYINKASYNGQFIITDTAAIKEEEKNNESNTDQLKKNFNSWEEVNHNLTIKNDDITYKLEAAMAKGENIECIYSKK